MATKISRNQIKRIKTTIEVLQKDKDVVKYSVKPMADGVYKHGKCDIKKDGYYYSIFCDNVLISEYISCLSDASMLSYLYQYDSKKYLIARRIEDKVIRYYNDAIVMEDLQTRKHNCQIEDKLVEKLLEIKKLRLAIKNIFLLA